MSWSSYDSLVLHYGHDKETRILKDSIVDSVDHVCQDTTTRSTSWPESVPCDKTLSPPELVSNWARGKSSPSNLRVVEHWPNMIEKQYGSNT